jgi:hypothetical protein
MSASNGTTILSNLHHARAQRVEVKLLRTQSFLENLTAEDVEWLRADPQIGVHMRVLARELETLASAVAPEMVSIEDAEREQVL